MSEVPSPDWAVPCIGKPEARPPGPDPLSPRGTATPSPVRGTPMRPAKAFPTRSRHFGGCHGCADVTDASSRGPRRRGKGDGRHRHLSAGLLLGQQNMAWVQALAAYAETRASGFRGSFWEWRREGGHFAWPANPKHLSMTQSETVQNSERLNRCRVLPASPDVDPSGTVTMLSHLKIAEGGGDLVPRPSCRFACSQRPPADRRRPPRQHPITQRDLSAIPPGQSLVRYGVRVVRLRYGHDEYQRRAKSPPRRDGACAHRSRVRAASWSPGWCVGEPRAL